jgi:hypothetical protein
VARERRDDVRQRLDVLSQDPVAVLAHDREAVQDDSCPDARIALRRPSLNSWVSRT